MCWWNGETVIEIYTVLRNFFNEVSSFRLSIYPET